MTPKKRYSLVALAIGSFMYVSNALTILMYIWLPDHLIQNQWISWSIQDLSSLVGILFAMLLVYRIPTKKREPKPMHIQDFLLTLGVVETTSLLSAMMILVVFTILGVENGTSIVDEIVGNDLLVQLVFVCITGPIIEELICRKLVIDKLRDTGEKQAIILSALFFGLMHGNVYQFAYAFPVGLIFAYVYLRTNNISYTILLHMLMNLTGVLTIPWITPLSIYATTYVIFFRRPKLHFEEPQENIPLKTIICNGGMLFAAVIIVIHFIVLGIH